MCPEKLAAYWMSGVSFSGRCRNFSVCHIIQIVSGVQPSSHEKGTRGLFSWE